MCFSHKEFRRSQCRLGCSERKLWRILASPPSPPSPFHLRDLLWTLVKGLPVTETPEHLGSVWMNTQVATAWAYSPEPELLFSASFTLCSGPFWSETPFPYSKCSQSPILIPSSLAPSGCNWLAGRLQCISDAGAESATRWRKPTAVDDSQPDSTPLNSEDQPPRHPTALQLCSSACWVWSCRTRVGGFRISSGSLYSLHRGYAESRNILRCPAGFLIKCLLFLADDHLCNICISWFSFPNIFPYAVMKVFYTEHNNLYS